MLNSPRQHIQSPKRYSMAYTIKINGKEVPLDFEGENVIHLDPFHYGVFDVIGKKNDGSEVTTLLKNCIVTLTNFGSTEGPLITEASTCKKVCSLKNLQELKSSEAVDLLKERKAPPGKFRVLSIGTASENDVEFVKDCDEVAEAFTICTTYNYGELADRTYYCFDDQGNQPGAKPRL